jgi:hypothetical protein
LREKGRLYRGPGADMRARGERGANGAGPAAAGLLLTTAGRRRRRLLPLAFCLRLRGLRHERRLREGMKEIAQDRESKVEGNIVMNTGTSRGCS